MWVLVPFSTSGPCRVYLLYLSTEQALLLQHQQHQPYHSLLTGATSVGRVIRIAGHHDVATEATDSVIPLLEVGSVDPTCGLLPAGLESEGESRFNRSVAVVAAAARWIDKWSPPTPLC